MRQGSCFLCCAAGLIIGAFALSTAHAVEYHILPSLTLSQAFDDNIFSNSVDQESDTYTVVSPAIDLLLNTETTRHTIRYALVYERYWFNGDLNGFSHFGTYRGRFLFEDRGEIDVLQRVSYAPTNSTQFFPETAIDPQQVRLDSLRSVSQVRPLIFVTPRTTFEIPVRFVVQLYEGQDATEEVEAIEAFDTYEAAGSFVVDHRATEKDHLLPSVTYSNIWYSEQEDRGILGFDFSWRRDWLATFRTNAGIGVGTVFGYDTGSQTTNIVGQAGATKEFERWRLSGAYLRTLTSGAGFGTTMIQDTIRTSLTWTPGENWIVAPSFAYYHSKSDTSGTDLSFQGIVASAGILYRFSPIIGADLRYDYRIQESTDEGDPSFSRNFVILSIVLTYPEHEREII